MKLKNFILIFFALALICSLNRGTSAQLKLTIKDKREIIKLVLESRDFTDAIESFQDKTPNLSMINIPIEIQKNFPKTKHVNFHLLTPEYIKEAAFIYYFSFGKFRIYKRKVYVWFYENYYHGGGRGSEDVLQKVKGKWKMIKPKTIRFSVWQT